MKKILKKDLVIPAGTIFDEAPTKTERVGDGHIQAVIGITKDSCGYVEYFVGEDEEALKEWFGDIE